MAITTATQAAELVNLSLANLGYGDYTIDTTSGDTIENGFKAIAALAPEFKNSVLNQVNVILVYRNYGTMFNESKNPIRKFLRNDINYGGGEEDIYHEIIEPVTGNWAYDFDGSNDDLTAEQVAKNLVKFYKYNVEKKFHAKKSPIDIPMSITEYELKQIFTPNGFARYIDVKMANLQWSAEVALLNMGIANVRNMVNKGDIVFKTGYDLNSTNGVTSVVESLRTITDAMGSLSTQFNKSGVNTISDKEDIFLFTTPEFVNRIQTRGYANAFNVEYYRENNQLVVLPYGTDLGTDPTTGEKVHAILIDRRAIVMSIFYWNVKPFIVSNTDYVNYFLKAQILNGYNEFFNAVAITGDSIDGFQPIDEKIFIVIPANTTSQTSFVRGAITVNGTDLLDTETLEGEPLSAHVSALDAVIQVPKGSFFEVDTTVGVVPPIEITVGDVVIPHRSEGFDQSFYAYENVYIATAD